MYSWNKMQLWFAWNLNQRVIHFQSTRGQWMIGFPPGSFKDGCYIYTWSVAGLLHKVSSAAVMTGARSSPLLLPAQSVRRMKWNGSFAFLPMNLHYNEQAVLPGWGPGFPSLASVGLLPVTRLDRTQNCSAMDRQSRGAEFNNCLGLVTTGAWVSTVGVRVGRGSLSHPTPVPVSTGGNSRPRKLQQCISRDPDHSCCSLCEWHPLELGSECRVPAPTVQGPGLQGSVESPTCPLLAAQFFFFFLNLPSKALGKIERPHVGKVWNLN